MHVVKAQWQYKNEARYFVSDFALRQAQAAPGRPYRRSAQDLRTAKAHIRRLDFEEAKEIADRRSRSGRGLRVVALRRPYHMEFVR